MDTAPLKARLSELEPIFLGPGTDGTLRVLEKSGRAVCDIAAHDLPGNEEIVSQIQTLFLSASNSDRQSKISLSIHLLHEAIVLPDIDRATVALANLIDDGSHVDITIHLDQPTADWAAIAMFAKSAREKLNRPGDIAIRLIAPFGEFNEEEMTRLFDFGVRFRFAAGWVKGCAEGEIPLVDKAGTKRLFPGWFPHLH